MANNTFLTYIPKNYATNNNFEIYSQSDTINAQNPFNSSQNSSGNDYCTFSYKIPQKTKNILSFKQIQENYENYLLEKKFKSFANKKEIQNMISANPTIKNILNNNGIPRRICIANLNNYYRDHFVPTMKIAEKISKELNLSDNDIKKVKEAALFHDFGKVFIPEEILNKKGELTLNEEKIMHQHEILGYELLKTTNMDKDVLQIIKNHHTYKPKLANDKNALLTQIVSVADIFTALATNERPYKKAMSYNQTFEILNKMCEENKIDKKIVDALKTSIKESN